MFLVILLPVLAPAIYVRRKLSHKYSLSQDESRKAIIFYIISGFIAGLVMGLLALTLEQGSEEFDPILFLIILPLIMTTLMTFIGWLTLRQFSKSPSRIAYILPDWLLRLFDPFYIPPYGKKRDENKTRRVEKE
jgi:fructose-specific phosphotransferase system IIC component